MIKFSLYFYCLAQWDIKKQTNSSILSLLGWSVFVDILMPVTILWLQLSTQICRKHYGRLLFWKNFYFTFFFLFSWQDKRMKRDAVSLSLSPVRTLFFQGSYFQWSSTFMLQYLYAWHDLNPVALNKPCSFSNLWIFVCQ